MKLRTLVLGGLVAVGLCGCLRTQHVEQSYYSNSGVGEDGRPTSCQHATHDERNWCGPWFVQPDRARP